MSRTHRLSPQTLAARHDAGHPQNLDEQSSRLQLTGTHLDSSTDGDLGVHDDLVELDERSVRQRVGAAQSGDNRELQRSGPRSHGPRVRRQPSPDTGPALH